MTATFKIVEPRMLDIQDLKDLQAAIEAEKEGSKIADVCQGSVDNLYQIWQYRDEGGGHGIVVTRVEETLSKEKLLWIWLLAGRGMMKHFAKGLEDIETFAGALGIKKLKTHHTRKGMTRFATRHLGFIPVSTITEKEIKNVEAAS